MDYLCLPCLTVHLMLPGPWVNKSHHKGLQVIDMPLKYSPDIVMENFLKLPNATTKEGPSKKVLKEFLADNFSPVGSDLIPYQFSDWQEEPPFLNQLKDNMEEWKLRPGLNETLMRTINYQTPDEIINWFKRQVIVSHNSYQTSFRIIW